MKSIQLELPESTPLSERDIKIILAGELYEREQMTLGEAAQLAGISKRSFIEEMGKYGYSIISDSVEDLRSDIKNAYQ